MSELGPEADLAAALVERAGRALPGAEVSVEADRHRLSLTRFANSVIHQNVAEDSNVVRLQVHHDGRTASGSVTGTDHRDLDALVERIVESVRVAPLDPTWPGLAPRASSGTTSQVDAATAGASPAERAAVVRDFVDAAGGLETAGYVRTNHWTGAFASSVGQAVTGEATECGLSGIARLDGADGVARLAPLRIADLDGAVLGARAAAKARAWTEPVDLTPDRYEVVLEPNAVLDVLGNLAAYAFGGRSLNEGQSFLRLGEHQFDPAVTIVDDPLEAGLGYDSEGTPRSRVPLVEAGRSAGVTHDRRTASVAGTTSTGHHLTGAPAPTARHLVLSGPDSSLRADEVEGPMVDSATADLVAGMERGILVSDFWYTRVLDPRSVAMTGLTRNGVWLVEHGEVTRPVRNFRFTQAYAQALSPGHVLAVGRTPAPLPGDTYTTTSPRYVCPALHLASWNFTGGSAG